MESLAGTGGSEPANGVLVDHDHWSQAATSQAGNLVQREQTLGIGIGICRYREVAAHLVVDRYDSGDVTSRSVADLDDRFADRLETAQPGIGTVVFESVFGARLSRADREELTSIIEEAADTARIAQPLAWLRLERDEQVLALRLRIWPAGRGRTYSTFSGAAGASGTSGTSGTSGITKMESSTSTLYSTISIMTWFRTVSPLRVSMAKGWTKPSTSW